MTDATNLIMVGDDELTFIALMDGDGRLLAEISLNTVAIATLGQRCASIVRYQQQAAIEPRTAPEGAELLH